MSLTLALSLLLYYFLKFKSNSISVSLHKATEITALIRLRISSTCWCLIPGKCHSDTVGNTIWCRSNGTIPLATQNISDLRRNIKLKWMIHNCFGFLLASLVAIQFYLCWTRIISKCILGISFKKDNITQMVGINLYAKSHFLKELCH